MKEGMKEGLEKGLEKGEQKKQIEIARKMREDGISIDILSNIRVFNLLI
jgi:predicted transposase YdaD